QGAPGQGAPGRGTTERGATERGTTGRSVAAQGASEQDAGAAAARGALQAGGPRPPSTFAIADLRSKRVAIIAGTAPALSADGQTLTYVAREGAEFLLMLGPTTGMQGAVVRTTERLDAPALSADGRRIGWQMMPRDDWEIFVADVDGASLKNARRVTREIQH